MQELIVNSLLIVVIVMATVLFWRGKQNKTSMTKKQQVMLGRIGIATTLMLILQLLPAAVWSTMNGWISGLGDAIRLVLYLADYLIIGYDILMKAFKGHSKPPGL